MSYIPGDLVVGGNVYSQNVQTINVTAGSMDQGLAIADYTSTTNTETAWWFSGTPTAVNQVITIKGSNLFQTNTSCPILTALYTNGITPPTVYPYISKVDQGNYSFKITFPTVDTVVLYVFMSNGYAN